MPDISFIALWSFQQYIQSFLFKGRHSSGHLILMLIGPGAPTKLHSSPCLEMFYNYWSRRCAWLCATFESKAPDPNWGGLKNQEKIYQFCAVVISFPTKGASFKPKKYWNWSLIHQDILSVNCFLRRIFLSIIDCVLSSKCIISYSIVVIVF